MTSTDRDAIAATVGLRIHHGMNTDLVTTLIERARVSAQDAGKAVAIAVVDTSAILQGFLRMDDAPLLAVQIAQDKAFTAASFGIPTHHWHEFIKNDPPLLAGIPSVPRMVVFGGGYPLYLAGHLVGAIGVSGGHYTDDMRIAESAMKSGGLDHC